MFAYEESFTVHPQGYAGDSRLRTLNITVQYSHMYEMGRTRVFTEAKIARKTFLFYGQVSISSDISVVRLSIVHLAKGGQPDGFTGPIYRSYTDDNFNDFTELTNHRVYDYNGYTEHITFPADMYSYDITKAIHTHVEDMLRQMAMGYCDRLIQAKRP